jgi:hypothetical protein
MIHRLLGRMALLCLTLALIVACQRGDGVSAPRQTAVQDQGRAAATPARAGTDGEATYANVTGEPLGKGIFIGAPRIYGNLTVFPVLAKTQLDVGPFISLHDALEKGTVEVRELGADQSAQPQSPSAALDGQAPQQVQGDSAQVGKLVIQNKGDIRVYAIAGTIVKGGKQDRQIGQDFIIGAKETVPIDAFCVEQGRWNGVRDGHATGGQFTSVKQLANHRVRVAGQYKGDQSEVWSKVAEVNKANNKKSASDSLMATADDGEMKTRRDELGRKVLADFDRMRPAGAVVGYAYAIDGEVKGVRWFAHHSVFLMFREVLINTVVVDAITAKEGGAAPADAVPSAKSVAQFVERVRKAPDKPKVRVTSGDNVNEYTQADNAYRSSTVLKKKPRSADNPEPAAKPVEMSVDFVVE